MLANLRFGDETRLVRFAKKLQCIRGSGGLPPGKVIKNLAPDTRVRLVTVLGGLGGLPPG